MDNPKELAAVCEGLLASHGQPVLVESFLPGREFTVGILGSGEKARALGVMEVILRPEAKADVYSMEYKENFEDFVDYRLATGPIAQETKKQALAAWRALGCLDGGRVDLRCDGKGVPNFMEVNPLAGLHPVHSDLPIMCGLLGIEFRELIAEILDSAMLRAERSNSRIAGGARVPGPAAWRPEKIAIGQCAS